MIADTGFRTVVVSLQGDHVAPIRNMLLLLQAGVLLLLVIGAANLINLLLIRSNGRIKELAVRLAMGASWQHIVGEVLVETTLIVVLGGLLGISLGASGIHLIASVAADKLPLGARIVFDARLAVEALFASLILGLIVALPVAWFHLADRCSFGQQWFCSYGCFLRFWWFGCFGRHTSGLCLLVAGF